MICYIITSRLIHRLDEDDGARSRLDYPAFVQFMNSLHDGWDNRTMMGIAVSRKDSQDSQKPAKTKEYRGRRREIPGIRELDREKTEVFNQMEQWCLEYAVRSTDFCGCPITAVSLHDDDAMLWTLVAGGFRNRHAVSVHECWVHHHQSRF